MPEATARLVARVAGRFARDALALGEGEVCARFQRSVYLRLPGGKYACVGDASLGCGPLNALVDGFAAPPMDARLRVAVAAVWTAPVPPPHAAPDLAALQAAARGRVPAEGLGCLVVGSHNGVSGHAQPALDALDRWLVGNALADEAAMLVGLGPGLTPSGDDFLGGVMLALHHVQRPTQARGLWRWLEPRLARTSAISAAHLAAAAAGEGHEALHAALAHLFQRQPGWPAALDRLDAIGHCSGWDALAGAAAVARNFG
ncbi:MAG TPA: DUF2877 domain-containing protein [Burkholderiales bacterium]|nr:DUF2877 domain-containing protein [Burkholderiales bacterium]